MSLYTISKESLMICLNGTILFIFFIVICLVGKQMKWGEKSYDS